jgi:Tol biopolymer transport system component
LSPGGLSLAYSVPDNPNDEADLHVTTYVLDLAAGKSKSLDDLNVLSWSPKGSLLLGQSEERLVLVDIESGKRRELARGSLGQAAFSPDGQAIAFARNNGMEAPEWRSDIFSVRLSDGSITQLTRDGHSDMPVWGADWIAFRRFHYAGSWTVGAIYLMRPDGSDPHELARGKETPTPTFLGLDPLDFSDDGTRLLGCAASEFYCYPVTFTVPGGKSYEITVGKKGVIQAADLSADGQDVLVHAGGFDDHGDHVVYAVPFEGGQPRVLARNASSPSWSP